MRFKTSLSQRIADTIYEQIITQKKYAPGDKLPGENDLAAEFGVSRTTLREAIRSLTAQGVLTVAHGKGTFVSTEVKNFRNVHFGDLGKLRMKLLDVFELRRVIEIEAVSMACQRASDQEIEEICEKARQVSTCIGEATARMIADEDFHQAIANASHNEFIIELMPMIHRAAGEALIQMGSDEILAQNAIRDHALIIDSLLQRDPEMAKSAMSIHMSHAIHSLHSTKLTEENSR